MEEWVSRPIGKTGWRFNIVVAVSMVIIAIGLYSIVLRMTQGLGVTNLNDYFPWGLWIAVDVMTGVALAAGGFTTAFIVRVLHAEKYKPLIWPAILTAFVGYILVILGLAVDIGRPWAFWHPFWFTYWQPNSVLFEVFWCVALYTFVLAIEFAPIPVKSLGWMKLQRFLEMISMPAVLAGVILSTLHQSSLGGLFTIAVAKVHPLWYSPILPVLFFLSAVAVGPAMVNFEAIVSAKAFKRGHELKGDLLGSSLQGLSYVTLGALILYLIFRVGDLAVRGNLGLAFIGREGVIFLGEIGLGVVLPIMLLMSAKVRRQVGGLLIASSLVIGGVVANRVNTAITAKIVPEGAWYFPNALEFSITISFVAVAILAYALVVKYLPILPHFGTKLPLPAPSGISSSASPVVQSRLSVAGSDQRASQGATPQ